MNQTGIQRIMTTTSTAIFVPFTTQELFQGGEALYYGLNALSNNLIMVDRKRLKTPNGLILGTPGSGKSFATKREILNVFLITDDDIIICDPEGEYFPLVNALNGEVIKISAKSNDYINPMEVNLDIKAYHSVLRIDITSMVKYILRSCYIQLQTVGNVLCCWFIWCIKVQTFIEILQGRHIFRFWIIVKIFFINVFYTQVNHGNLITI